MLHAESTLLPARFSMMETSLASFVGSFLQCVTEGTPTQQQIDALMAVARRADFERLTKGDFVIPLNSPKLKEAANPTTPLGSFLLNPTQDNTKLIERALEGCKLPVAKIVVQSNMLRIHLDKAKVMQTFIPSIAKEGLRYGASQLLQQVPVTLSHCIAEKRSSSLKSMRGEKLTNHLAKILEHCGAKVSVREIHGTSPRTRKGEDLLTGDREECEPKGSNAVSLEPYDHPLEQNTQRNTSLAPKANNAVSLEPHDYPLEQKTQINTPLEQHYHPLEQNTQRNTPLEPFDHLLKQKTQGNTPLEPLDHSLEQKTQGNTPLEPLDHLLKQKTARNSPLEQHNHPLDQKTQREAPLTPPEQFVVNEKQSKEVNSEHRDSQAKQKQKKPCIETDFDVLSSRKQGRNDENRMMDKIESAVPDATEGKMCVVCVPENQCKSSETQTLQSRVSERKESLVKNEIREAENTSPGLNVSDEQKDKLVSGMEFVITDSMKGVQRGPWVYQYVGVVDAKTGKPWTGSVQDYCRILLEELKQTSKMRQKEEDDEWLAFLEEQVERCLTLHLLSPTHSNQLRVEVDGDTHNTKEVSFMLYNYARLCSIFDHFEQCVQEGDVAPLPPAEDVDFSLLRTDEEWDLVWVYLLRWPDIVEDMASGVLGRSRQPKTALVSRFLYSLGHRWSEYYGRHQVLCEGLHPHLLPLVYARLHLLRALATLMRTCFALLGVHSLPSQM
ncbi:DALR anticodon-binding domain-containing protein 3 [Chionoecetes opilio]|uniref:DALR anticodon-binding domain-containing protein 3 n=1 Tax=Chionoecetes opilio TaxID=41210 RepID=A0A8J4YAJ3_CHIOP|nr:DALR anticodon-binding domain-containing protein 3 [Chionoecetes opilio]